jgi:hypothetical protein
MCASEEFFFRILIPAYVARNIATEHLPRNNFRRMNVLVPTYSRLRRRQIAEDLWVQLKEK